MNISVKCEVHVYSDNLGKSESVIIESVKFDREMVKIIFGDKTIKVCSNDMMEAIKRCTDRPIGF